MENIGIPMKNVLIPLDILLNIDLGILKVVQNEFNNKKIINDLIYYNSDNRIIYHILNREFPNVLSLVIKDHYKYDLNTLLKEIYNTYNLKILDSSPFTDILNIVITGSGINSFNMDILCNNQEEREYVLDRMSYLKCNFNLLINDLESLDLTKYDTILINNIDNIKNIIPRLANKNLYITKARYNLEDDGLGGYKLPNYITDNIPEFLISLISTYNMDETFFIDG